MEADIDLGDTHSLQRGARTFVNYCLSCHSASFMRYSRIAKDLEIPEELVKNNLMFTTDKIGDTLDVAMPRADAENWFLGVAPPDLSVIARARGANWLYTFLSTFYLAPERPTGVNNLAFKDTAMPHVLWELQGWQEPVLTTDQNGDESEVIDYLKLAQPGKLSAQEYRQTVRDLVAFLVYLAEPAALVRHRIGIGVLLFLVILLSLAYALKKEYWKDVR